MINRKIDIHAATNHPPPIEHPSQVPLARMVVAGWWIDVTADGDLIIHCDGYAIASFDDERVIVRREGVGKKSA